LGESLGLIDGKGGKLLGTIKIINPWMKFFFPLWVIFLGGCAPFISKDDRKFLSQVRVARIEDIAGIRMMSCLEKWISQHPCTDGPYVLRVRLKESQNALAIAPNALTINYRYRLKAYYTLSVGGQAPIFVQERTAFGSYNIVRHAYYSDTFAQEAARDSCIQNLSMWIIMDILQTLQKHSSGG
jgi:hypothetical protein